MDIKINQLLILFLLIIAETPIKPKLISNFTDDFPIIKWIILYLISLEIKNGIIYFLILYVVFQSFYFVDTSLALLS